MKWTSEPPTEPGWYWYDPPSIVEQQPVQVFDGGGVMWGPKVMPEKELHGKWWPEKIEPPESDNE